MKIYLITNLQNNKVYVGQTSGPIHSRWQGHWRDSRRERTLNYPLYNAMRKYGLENFDVQEIGEASNQEKIDNLEKLWIILLKSQNEEFGYNLREGGHRGKNSKETRMKISRARLGKPSWNRGVPMRPETKAKLRETSMGNKNCVGRKLSEETKRKIGTKSSGRMLGYKHTEEAKAKIAISKLGKKRPHA